MAVAPMKQRFQRHAHVPVFGSPIQVHVFWMYPPLGANAVYISLLT